MVDFAFISFELRRSRKELFFHPPSALTAGGTVEVRTPEALLKHIEETSTDDI